ncbi:MAG TPA: DNA primase [Burkholderiales bacterium]|nr:DNA primase [Burkholderiales bacterium]
MIPEGFIQTLLNRVDIVEVIERHVQLKKAGANYLARCPFHSEKTPSFSVSPSKQFYYCFGCQAHGSAIGFTMQYHGLSFVDAVQELAQQVGLAIPVEPRSEAVQAIEATRRAALEALRETSRVYRDQLKRSDNAIAYLKQRGVTGEIAARFCLGYAPSGGHTLGLSEHGDRALIDAGLVIEGEGGRRYDRFRDRIMFPIRDSRGAVIAFGGRVVAGGDPKYLNSPETALFEKGRELYGLFEARAAIRESGSVLVVEGYMDVVALAQHGFGYAVATLGTSITPIQAQKLLRLCDRIIFCFDGDQAGRRAAWRALENSIEKITDGKEVRFLLLPEGHDPDSFVRAFGAEALAREITRALPLSSYLFQEVGSSADRATPEGRARLVRAAKPLIEKVAAPALRLLLGKRLAELATLDLNELNSVVGVKPAIERRPISAPIRNRPALAEKLTEMLLASPRLASLADRQAIEASAGTELGTQLAALAAVLDYIESCPDIPTMAAIFENFRETVHEAVLERRKPGPIWERLGETELRQEFADGWSQLREQVRKARLRELSRRYGREGGWTSEEQAEYRRLQGA